MGSSSSGGKGSIVGINVTPMVDIMLVLLVIMMVSATVTVSQSLKLELPKNAPGGGAQPRLAQIAIDQRGGWTLDGRAIAPERVVAALTQARQEAPEVIVIISASPRAEHGWIVHAIDLAKQAGIEKFAVSMPRAGSPDP